jgi:hypothetical protein
MFMPFGGPLGVPVGGKLRVTGLLKLLIEWIVTFTTCEDCADTFVEFGVTEIQKFGFTQTIVTVDV